MILGGGGGNQRSSSAPFAFRLLSPARKKTFRRGGQAGCLQPLTGGSPPPGEEQGPFRTATRRGHVRAGAAVEAWHRHCSWFNLYCQRQKLCIHRSIKRFSNILFLSIKILFSPSSPPKKKSLTLGTPFPCCLPQSFWCRQQ